MMKFIEYLEKVLRYPLYWTSSIFRSYFSAISAEFDELPPDAITAVEQYYPVYSEMDSVVQTGWDRGVYRLLAETDAALRERVSLAYAFNSVSSTVQGLTDIISVITDTPFQIKEGYTYQSYIGFAQVGMCSVGSGYGYFYFEVLFEYILSDEEFQAVNSAVYTYRPAYTVYRILYTCSLDQGTLGDMYLQ